METKAVDLEEMCFGNWGGQEFQRTEELRSEWLSEYVSKWVSK